MIRARPLGTRGGNEAGQVRRSTRAPGAAARPWNAMRWFCQNDKVFPLRDLGTRIEKLPRVSGQRTFTDGETQPLDAAPLVRALRRGEVLARSADGRVFGPGETEAAAQAARRLLGEGSVTLRGREVRSRELAPYAALSALLPLGLVLWRRNLR